MNWIDVLVEKVEQAERARTKAERELADKARELSSANQVLLDSSADLRIQIELRTVELREVRDKGLEAEDRLRVAKELAERKSEAKSRFLAHMSHEIRTPLAAVLGYAELLGSRENLDPEVSAWTESLRLSAQHLLTLVGEVLDMSKIEAGELRVDRQPTDIEAEVREVVSILEQRARAKGLSLELELSDGGLPKIIQTDPLRLRQILLNLGSNAIKFTDQGGVRIKLEVVGERLRIEVADTGRGMDEVQLRRAFEPYQQVDPSELDRRLGTGLGLDISRRLMGMLGGSLVAESTPGEGSCFRLELPLELGWEQGVEDEQGCADSGVWSGLLDLRVLVVDDAIDNRRILRLMLERAGAEVETLESGIEALEYMGRSGEERPDVVLLDLQMVGLDGIETLRRLRAMQVDIPVVILSADATPETVSQCTAAGADAYLTKPVTPALLTTRLRALVDGGSQAETRGGAPSDSLTQGKAVAANMNPVALDGGRLEVELRGPADYASESGDEYEYEDEEPLPPWLVEIYLASLRTYATELPGQASNAAWGTVREVCHRLAGSGSSYGFPSLTRCARACERGIADGEDEREVSERLDALLLQIQVALGPGESAQASA